MEENNKNDHPEKSSPGFADREAAAPGVHEQDASSNIKQDESRQNTSDDILFEKIEEGEHDCDDRGEVMTRKQKKSRGKSQLEKEIDIEALQNELKESNQKACEYFDGWQRERADFTNYRKRIERGQSENHLTAKADLIKKYLVILDDLELAMKSRPDQTVDSAWVNGIELIYRKLKNFLEAEGVKPIAETKEFDPNLHEAITHEENPDYQNGQIIEIIQQGYMLGDRILRPARVRVAK